MNVQMSVIGAAIASMPLLLIQTAYASEQTAAAPARHQAAVADDDIVNTLMAQRGRSGLGEEHGYALVSAHAQGTDAVGPGVARLHHTYKGVRVFGSESVVVTGARGAMLSESVDDRRQSLGRGHEIDVRPRLGAAAAIAASARFARGIALEPASAELLVYPRIKEVRVPAAAGKAESELNAMDVEEVVQRYDLAYLVRTRTLDGARRVFRDTIVNAHTGAIIKQWDALESIAGTGNSQYNGVVPLNTTQSGSLFKMVDPARGVGGPFGGLSVTNANHGSSAGALYTNTSNTWGDGKQYVSGGSTTNANGQTSAVNAMWGLRNMYDLYKNVVGWRGVDGQNTAASAAVHVNLDYAGAYYVHSCRCMFIGDGNATTNDLATVDLIGHELSHGVTSSTANLVYSGQSGGLNESHSDIAGEVVEAYARAGGFGTSIANTGNDWKTGTEISKTGQPIRWLYKPSKDGRSPDAWNSQIGTIDVHYSSGPNNRMYYFLSQGSSAIATSERHSRYLTKAPMAMTGIGTDKAFRIWFRALSTKFTSTTNYVGARARVLAAAEEMYGVGSREAKAVQRAYAAINVGLDVAE